MKQVRKYGLAFILAAALLTGSALACTVPESAPAADELIAAVGDHGVQGYLRFSDLNPEINNPREAMAYMVSFNDHLVKPLYNAAGEVIGTFTLQAMPEAQVISARKALAAMGG